MNCERKESAWDQILGVFETVFVDYIGEFLMKCIAFLFLVGVSLCFLAPFIGVLLLIF